MPIVILSTKGDKEFIDPGLNNRVALLLWGKYPSILRANGAAMHVGSKASIVARKLFIKTVGYVSDQDNGRRSALMRTVPCHHATNHLAD